jgi:hypothetical protein
MVLNGEVLMVTDVILTRLSILSTLLRTDPMNVIISLMHGMVQNF